MKRVLLIDPWGINNTSEYLNGLIYGLSELVELTVFTNTYFELKIPEVKCEIHRTFFPKSERMDQGKKRSILRGIEYIKAYLQILWHLKNKGPYDVVHINWLLFYPLDIYFLKQIKKHCKKLVYTAHNVLPHENGESQKQNLAEIYHIVDRIILHGESVKKEFIEYFPSEEKKIFLQNHGANLFPKIFYDESQIETEIKKRFVQYERIYICFGNMFYNKGADRLVRIWKNNRELDRVLLVVAGRISGEYKELLDISICDNSNIILLNQYLEDNFLNYLIDQSQMIILPYRHASMSGVIFTAADFKKPVLCTDVGAIAEYLHNDIDGFIVSNDETELQNAIIKTLSLSKEELDAMGQKLNHHIQEEFGWDQLGIKIVEQCYVQSEE